MKILDIKSRKPHLTKYKPTTNAAEFSRHEYPKSEFTILILFLLDSRGFD